MYLKKTFPYIVPAAYFCTQYCCVSLMQKTLKWKLAKAKVLKHNNLSENHSIPFADIIGHNVTVSIVLADGALRYFNGIISRFAHTSVGVESDNDHNLSAYSATMVPWLWLLTRPSDSRIFPGYFSVGHCGTNFFRKKFPGLSITSKWRL